MNSFLVFAICIAAAAALPQRRSAIRQGSFQPQGSFQDQRSSQQAIPEYLEEEQPHQYIPILSKTEVRRPDQSFDLKYESADGQAFVEKAEIQRNAANTGDVLVKSGSYAYTAPDGTPISVSYIADEYGFRATGNHIPVAPTA